MTQGTQQRRRSPFSMWLELQMRKHGYSNRSLGKRTDPDDRERGRRRVQRHLAGMPPSPASIRTYVEVFGEEYSLSEDDEEAAPMGDLDARLMAAIRELRDLRLLVKKATLA